MRTLVAGTSAKSLRELVGAGRTLGAVAALCLGPAVEDLGADEVLWWDGPALAESPSEAGSAALEAACREIPSDLVLLPADADGRDWAPRLASRLGAGLITDCVGWERAGDELRFRRPVYGGKAVAVFTVRTPVAVAVVRAGAFAAAEPGTSPVRRIEVAVGDRRPRIVERSREAAEGPSLEDARVVISGGRGLGGPEAFRLLEGLAALVGGAVGASRAAVDEGWVPPSRQVGQTGKSVGPELYLAVGISGASQHMAGVSAARNVVAINTDADAPIFEQARLGVVGDYREVLPALQDALRDVLS